MRRRSHMLHTPISLGRGRRPRFRRWKGELLHPFEEARMYFRNEGPVPETLRGIHALLSEAGIPHIFMGAAALDAHGYERMTQDVDLCMRSDDFDRLRRDYVGVRYQPVAGRRRRFYDPQTQVTLDVLIAGQIAGDSRRQHSIKFPDPSEAVLIDDVPMPTLPRLIELKLVAWRYKDLGDVVELIRIHNLGEAFSSQLDATVRSAYLQCCDQRIDEDRYNPELRDDPPAE